MAERRMFNTRLTTNNDSFHDLSAVQRSLFYDCIGNADDYGMLGNLNQIISYAGRGTKKSDGQALVDKEYLIDCENGFYAIREWYLHNYASSVNTKNKEGEKLKNAEERRQDILENAKRHLLTLDKENRYIKVSADFFLSNTTDRVVKSSEEKVSEEKVSCSTDAAAAAATDRTTTTTDVPQLNDLISLWNDNPVTVKITAADIEDKANSLSVLISRYTYPDLMDTIYHLANKRYFADERNVDFSFFIDKYNEIKSGKYDKPIVTVPMDYSDKYGEWIDSGCALPYEEYLKQEEMAAAERRKAVAKMAEEQAAAERAALEQAEQAAAEREKGKQEQQERLEQWRKANNKPDATMVDMILAERKERQRG